MSTSVDGFELPGASEIEGVIAVNGDHPVADPIVRDLVSRALLVVIGQPTGDGRVLLLHCEVPVGGELIPVLPVFTRFEYADAGYLMNPDWIRYEAVVMRGQEILADLGEAEWLAVNPWTGHEFKVEPAGA